MKLIALSQEHQAVSEAAWKVLSKELAPRVEATESEGRYCVEAHRKLGELGLLAPILPEPYGSGDLLAQFIVAERMGYFSCGFGLSALASVGLFGANVARLGTEEQRRKYLPGIASGEKIGCWGLTEPGAGSDAVSVAARCVREGEGDEYVINGSKTFITNAPIADYFIVITREYDAAGQPLGGDPQGFFGGTAFILERGMPGLRTGTPFEKLGHWSSPTGEVFLENVRVPVSQVLGKPGEAFGGMKVSLDMERAVFGALGTGMMEFCIHSVVRYASERKQFGTPILHHQMIQEKIAFMTASLEFTRTYLYQLVIALERGLPATKEAAVAKYFGSELAVRVAEEAVQCLGGYGYMREYQVERCLRDAKLFTIGGGTSEIQKLIIAKETVKELQKHGSS